MEPIQLNDPYDSCERGRCNHDLARAVGIGELWGTDGPFPSGAVALRPGAPVTLFDSDHQPYEPDIAVEQQRWAV